MNKTIMFLVLVIVACGFNNSTTERDKQLKNQTPQKIKKIVNEEVSKFMEPPFTNLSGVIYVNGESYQFHFGTLLNGKQANNQTLYEIGSITKTYTGLILSQAVYDKKVHLDDDIRNYLDGDYPNLQLSNNVPITLRHLITHTSGLPLIIHCYKNGQTTAEQIACFETFTKDDFFEKLTNVKLIDKSGKNYHYSGVGIQLVGYILEGVYQLSFQELFEKYVFSRSEEQNTFSELKYDENSNISVGKDSNNVSMPLINGFYKYAGGLKSSTSSMLSYIIMYLKNEDSVVEQAMNLLAGNNRYGRAFAWNTYNYDRNRKMLYHNGSTLGHSSWIALYPNQKIGIFLVTNVMTENSQNQLNEISNKIIDQINKYQRILPQV